MEQLVKKPLPETFSHKRGPLLERMSHMAHYQHTRALHEQMVKELEKLKATVGELKNFKNPREESDYLHKQKTLQVLTKQEKHMKSKLDNLQKCILEDMKTFDKEVTNTQ
jgi:hypothetical protein